MHQAVHMQLVAQQTIMVATTGAKDVTVLNKISLHKVPASK